MKKVDIFDEDNSIMIDDDFDTTDFEFFPADKKFTVSQSIKDDCFYNNQTFQYKISANPVELSMRTLESSHEPPLEYSIKDGVVLESELKKRDFIFPDRIEKLKKEIQWNKIPLLGNLGNYEVNLYILSKHPEIISREDYRKFLRESIERIKSGVAKVEEAVKGDSKGLQITKGNYGASIWFPTNESEKKESEEYYNLPEEKREDTEYGKKLKHVRQFTESLFTENSHKYVGIPEYEFRSSVEIVDYIEKLLEKKNLSYTKKEEIHSQKPNDDNAKVYSYCAVGLTIIFIILKLSGSVEWSWFAVLCPVIIWEGLGFVFGFLKAMAN